MLPSSICRLAQLMTLPWPLVCWVIPIAYISAPGLLAAISRAALRMSSAFTPQISATRSGGYSAILTLRSSKPSVRLATKS